MPLFSRNWNMTRVANRAVNILDTIPSISVMAKPFISSEATIYKINAVIKVVMFASRIVLKALW